jgi:hypothetical protein
MERMVLGFMFIFIVTLIVADMVVSLIPMSKWAAHSIIFGAMLMFGWIIKKSIDPDDRDPDGV